MKNQSRVTVKTQKDEILKVLENQDLSIAWCARRLGMSRQLLTAKINGDREFKGSELYLLKQILGFDSMDELFRTFFIQNVA